MTMSKYIKLEDAIHNINLEVVGRKEYTGDMKANLFFALDDLPTIEVSEDCISREYILGEAFMSDEYNRETKSFDLPVVSVRDIEDAPSVVPTTEQSSMVGEWIVADDESILFTVPFTEWIKLFCERHRLSDANVEIIKDILMKGEDDE